jgi:hypothetical protein
MNWSLCTLDLVWCARGVLRTLSCRTEELIPSVVFDADSDYVSVGFIGTIFFLKTRVLRKRDVSRAGHSSSQDQYFFVLTLPDLGSHIC